MSVLIKGMEMPKHVAVNGEKDTAYKCVILAHPNNSVELVIDIKFASAYDNGHNIQRYLITEIPAPHGRLIDADKLVWFIDNHIASGKKWVEFETIKDMINSLPTIIEAEVSE
ncbi:MAG: hypothetical protein II410_08445 [Ruminococcus sp.]|nr:hypothetical protein [Ruminococcus sp.]MBQ2442427.1 hypothetical protein [Ruminococcus sp.]MBQ4171652.1 hypothetical protein [Ruminococcus sp.]